MKKIPFMQKIIFMIMIVMQLVSIALEILKNNYYFMTSYNYLETLKISEIESYLSKIIVGMIFVQLLYPFLKNKNSRNESQMKVCIVYFSIHYITIVIVAEIFNIGVLNALNGAEFILSALIIIFTYLIYRKYITKRNDIRCYRK